MVHSIKMVYVTRTIGPAAQPPSEASADPMAPIIADFRATMTRIKCASSERLLRLGVSMAQLNIMYTLERTGEMTMSRLADVLNVSDSNATGLIDRLEERGFIERTRVPEDRRIVLVRLTEAGRGMLEEVDALSDELLRSVLDRLRPSQLPGVARAITDLRVAVEAVTDGTSDRHGASTPPPRSPATMRGSALAHDHPRRD